MHLTCGAGEFFCTSVLRKGNALVSRQTNYANTHLQVKQLVHYGQSESWIDSTHKTCGNAFKIEAGIDTGRSEKSSTTTTSLNTSVGELDSRDRTYQFRFRFVRNLFVDKKKLCLRSIPFRKDWRLVFHFA